MSQLVSDKILGNQLEGLLDEDSLSCFNIAKTKNKLKKEHDFILERTYYYKLVEAREMLPKISANYDFSTKVDGTITSNKIENYMIHLEKIENKYEVYRDNVMSHMNHLTTAEKIFIEEVFMRGADAETFMEMHLISDYSYRKLRKSAILKLAMEYDDEVLDV